MPTPLERYQSALHAMQTGVAYALQNDSSGGSPKHLRVGVNSALVETSALVQILIRLKLITKEEWISELAQRMEEEVASYQKELERDYGVKVTLL